MKIRDLKVVFICPDHNDFYKKRMSHMVQLLNSIGFKDVIHHKSSTESYPSCLSQAFINILTQYIDIPVLILEDDVEFTSIDTFDYVNDADAIYFGISKSGGHSTENRHYGDYRVEAYSDSQVRVLNMLTTHAILYNSKRYKLAVIEALKSNPTFHSDVIISRLQKDYKILANKNPSFYQSAALNTNPHSENWTRFSLP
jgi:hypothetical protein